VWLKLLITNLNKKLKRKKIKMGKQNDFSEPGADSQGSHFNETSQLELIKQWRTNLECLKSDIGAGSLPEMSEEQLSLVTEGIDYLDRTNKLLDNNADFLLSDSGFLKYKTQYMLVFDYLSRSEKTEEKSSISKFYFISRRKHIEQQQKKTPWIHSLVHLLFIPVVILLLVMASIWVMDQTQNNTLVKVILFWFFSVHISAAYALLKRFKKSAATPFRFRISLLGIHSLASLLKIGLVCVVPVLVAINFKHYWVDDVIIISLVIMCFFHYKPDNNLEDQVVSVDSSKKETSHA